MRKKWLLPLAATLVCAIGGLCLPSVVASAGVEKNELLSERFDSGVLDGLAWESSNVSLAEDEGMRGLTVRNANATVTGNAGFVTAEEISGWAFRMEYDVKTLSWPDDGGWIGFLLGSPDQTPVWNNARLNDGKRVLLMRHPSGVWYLNTHTKDQDGLYKNYRFEDGDGNEIARSSEDLNVSGFYALDFVQGTVIEDKTIAITLDVEGNFSMTMRGLGEARSEERVVVKTMAESEVKFDPFMRGYVGFAFQGTSKSFNGQIMDVRTYVSDEDGQEELKAQFHTESENIGSDYSFYYGGLPDCFSFSAPGKMLFTATATAASAVSQTPFTFDPDVLASPVGKNVELTQELYFTDFDEGDSFALNFGLKKGYVSELNKANTYSIVVTKGESLAFSVVRYQAGENGAVNATTVLENQAFSLVDGYAELTLTIDGNGETVVSLGETQSAPVRLQMAKGNYYFGYRLTGTAQVKVDGVGLKNATYGRPENKDIFADFTDEEINIDEWRLTEWGGNNEYESRFEGVYAKDGQLVFKNANTNASITSIPQFSNFEMTFDLTDVQRAGADEGKTSQFIGIVYGIAGPNDSFHLLHYQYKRPFISFRPSENGTSLTILNVENEIATVIPDKYDIFAAKSEGVIFNLKVTMTDGILTVAVKTSEETEYTVLAERQTGSAVTGCIRIFGYGDGVLDECANFTVDNLKITNTDENPNNKNDFGYTSNKAWTKWEGYEYTDTWNDGDLLPIKEAKKESGCSSVSAVGGVGAVLIGVAVAAVWRKKKDEE